MATFTAIQFALFTPFFLLFDCYSIIVSTVIMIIIGIISIGYPHHDQHSPITALFPYLSFILLLLPFLLI